MHAKAQTILPTRMTCNRTGEVAMVWNKRYVGNSQDWMKHIMSFMHQSTHIFFGAFIMTVFPNDAFFKQKHLRVISENTFRGEVILFSQNCSRIWQGFAVH